MSRLVGKKAPEFNMLTTKNMDTLAERVTNETYKGKYLVLFFYPLDFTFVCPTEIIALSDAAAEFEQLGAEILGVSTDSVHSHKAWINTPRDQNGLGQLNYPLAADNTQQVARDFGVLLEDEGIALRGLFIIDPEGIVQHATINSLNVGRNVDEVLRVLEAIQTGGLCPANWKKGEATL
ncbi:peroxiredoxin [Tumebacillus sp. ITR2]|uniref:Peroxiredoxin n=1 Tax=Tumebacillus amylolyticus TaxID=2801339 RepID=A0ABS1JAQ3_9BACL|nr:peroxiredoxin [Tumebacillus amylolyticus]MBL0387367.1 peroxiredoxin [Tumebacillus amylolyticus]